MIYGSSSYNSVGLYHLELFDVYALEERKRAEYVIQADISDPCFVELARIS